MAFSDNAAARICSELILGGQRSGKSRMAEQRAAHWLAASPAHRAVFVATALARDAEMRARIAKHQSDRAERLGAMLTVEEPLQLAQAIATHSRTETLVVVDCLTLWHQRRFPSLRCCKHCARRQARSCWSATRLASAWCRCSPRCAPSSTRSGV